METMPLFSGMTKSENGVRQILDKKTYEVESDYRNNGGVLLHLQEKNEQLLERIYELESQLNHDKEKMDLKKQKKK